MEEKDFEPELLDLADQYSRVIIAGLGLEWDVPIEKAENNETLIKKIRNHILFFYCKSLTMDKQDEIDIEIEKMTKEERLQAILDAAGSRPNWPE